MNNKAKSEAGVNPIAKMGNVLLRFSLKYMPDASIFAVLLTVLHANGADRCNRFRSGQCTVCTPGY